MQDLKIDPNTTSLIRPSPSAAAAKSLPDQAQGADRLPSRTVTDARLTPVIPSEPTEPKSVAAKTNDVPVAPASPEHSSSSSRRLQLEGKSSVVVLGLEAPAIRELSGHPGQLRGLIQSGALFTAPRGTAIHVRERESGVVKVLILEGSMAGREGWVRAWQVKAR
jgi:hypothetical protein